MELISTVVAQRDVTVGEQGFTRMCSEHAGDECLQLTGARVTWRGTFVIPDGTL
jgi:hypothetical protein